MQSPPPSKCTLNKVHSYSTSNLRYYQLHPIYPLFTGWSTIELHFSEDGVWLEWSMWSSCSVTCENGTQLRNRICQEPMYGGQECLGEYDMVMRCNTHECPGKSGEGTGRGSAISTTPCSRALSARRTPYRVRIQCYPNLFDTRTHLRSPFFLSLSVSLYL